MKPITHYLASVAIAFCIVLVGSSAIAEPGHGRAYGHSQVGVSGGGISGGGSSSAQLFPGDGLTAPIYKNSTDFFTTGSAEKLHKGDINFVPPNARDSAIQKTGTSDFINSSTAVSTTSSVTTSQTTTTSKSSAVAVDSATPKPDWFVNALSSGGSKSKPAPSPSPAPQASAAPSPSPAPVLVPKQPSIDPPPPT